MTLMTMMMMTMMMKGLAERGPGVIHSESVHRLHEEKTTENRALRKVTERERKRRNVSGAQMLNTVLAFLL